MFNPECLMVWVAEPGELVGLQTLPGARCHSPALSVVFWGGHTEVSGGTGSRLGLSSTHMGFVASKPRQGPDPNPHQALHHVMS